MDYNYKKHNGEIIMINEDEIGKRPKYTNLPYLHPSIDPDDLDADGKIKKSNREVHEVDGKKFMAYSTLGEGNFGKVSLAQDMESGEWVALKVLKQSSIAAASEYKMINKIGGGKGIKDQKVLVMSLISGQELFMFSQLKKASNLTDIEWLQVGIGMCESIEDMNEKFDILMRDIKGENFIYHYSTGRVTPTDFGSACDAGKDQQKSIISNKKSGSRFTLAPESDIKLKYSKRSEAYSVGRAYADTINLLDNRLDQLITENSQKFNDQDQMKIKNPELRKEILGILKQLTLENEESRMQLNVAAQKLRVIQKKYIEQEKRDLKVGILDLQSYSRLNDKDKKNLILHVKDFDRIMFIHSGHNLSQNKLLSSKLEVERILNDNNSLAKIASAVISGLPREELIVSACNRIQLEARRGAYNFDFYNIDTDNMNANLIKQVNEPVVKEIQKHLLGEIRNQPERSEENISKQQEKFDQFEKANQARIQQQYSRENPLQELSRIIKKFESAKGDKAIRIKSAADFKNLLEAESSPEIKSLNSAKKDACKYLRKHPKFVTETNLKKVLESSEKSLGIKAGVLAKLKMHHYFFATPSNNTNTEKVDVAPEKPPSKHKK